MKRPNQTGFHRLKAAWSYSWAGLGEAWRREEAFRLEVGLLVVAVPVAAFLATSIGQFALMIGSILLLMIVEILNSAIEATIDRIGIGIHELSRVAKDLGSAAVLLTALVPVAIWAAIVLDRLNLISL